MRDCPLCRPTDIVTVHGGGEYVRCFKSITGSLQWEHPASVDLTDER